MTLNGVVAVVFRYFSEIVSIRGALRKIAFMAKSGAQTLTFKSVTDKQTDKQTKKLNVFGHPGGG